MIDLKAQILSIILSDCYIIKLKFTWGGGERNRKKCFKNAQIKQYTIEQQAKKNIFKGNLETNKNENTVY